MVEDNWGALAKAHVRGVLGKTGATSVAALWAEKSDREMKHLPPPQNAYAGRSVEVRNGDIAHALDVLQGTLAKNNVFAELKRAARHEKKGYKRRRLSSERWRRRFAEEVRKKVQLVNEIRARGA
ncbi:hypothetical protein FA95DRAFT_1551843 [Auriscalpium vulgare]|uniref:Uncharacterized protein n=1 Tax=Auriscalpium vulgare TaxID=40419 RepID=A0ACB8SDM7_9AGAM|nr:hypothetical protein FA95DRAFT_1551843 [Auriscalpium vulgare]